MTTFVYKAKKSSAETVIGEVKARTQDEAIDLIHKLGLLPVSVEENAQTSTQPATVNTKSIKSKDIFLFTRQLSNMLRSGVSIPKALLIIEGQTHNQSLKNVITGISWEIKNGRSFSETLSMYPNIFSSLYITMVKAGEESGNLQPMLLNMASYQKKQDEIISRVRMALAYPSLMALVGCATVIFILSFVLPKMKGLFDSMGQNLPLATEILLSISGYLHKWGIASFFVLIILVSAFRYWGKTANGKAHLSVFVLHFPLFGEIILKTEIARFCRTLNLLGQGGVSLIKSLEISIPILSNHIIKTHLWMCAENLTGGGSLGNSIQQSKDIPQMVGQLISVGEESGNLNEVFLEVAEVYEQETEEKIRMIMTLIEPLMILAIGMVIGLIVFAMLLPIFQIDIIAH